MADPAEFILLAVQHYFIVHGKDVEVDKMKQLVQDLLPTPYIAVQNGDEKSKDKKTKPLMSDKQIDGIVESAIEKDAEVSRKVRCPFGRMMDSLLKFKRVVKRLKQKHKTRDQVKREIKKDVLIYAQNRWPMTFSRVFEVQLLSGPLIDEIPLGTVAIGRDRVRLLTNENTALLGDVNYSEITEILCDQ